MKLELRVDDKILKEPDFKIYTLKNDNDVIIIAMNVTSNIENQVKKAIENDEFKIEMDNGIVGLFVNDSLYSFDIGYFLKDHYRNRDQQHLSIAFAFLDENDNIKKTNLKVMRMVHN
ncbi:hypothetical protein FQU54_25390 [Salmonella enterica subsp. diarizonae]|nr:hypothetical protein [Salmonella enterica subsp. diarizonae]